MRNDLSAIDTALELLSRGLCPVALYPPGATIQTKDGPKIATGKEPIGAAWGKARPTETSLRQMLRKHPGAGVGVVLGPTGVVIDLEVDGPEGEASLRKLCGGEPPPTLGWSSRRGPHRLFAWDGRMTDIDPRRRAKITLPELPGLEIRLGCDKQAQSAVPPTIGEDGAPRLWNDCDVIAPMPEAALDYLTAALAESKRPQPHESVGATRGRLVVSADRDAAGLRKILATLCGKVAIAAEGDRHPTLLAVARTLGGYLHHGHLTEAEVTSELTRAAQRAGLPDAEITAAIRDGLAYGRAEPLPWPDKRRTSRPRSRNGMTAKATAPGDDEAEKETQAQALLRLAEPAELTRTDDGRAFARVPVGSHHENHEIRSAGFKRWLTREFYREQDRPPSADAMQGTLGVLEARAQFDGTTEPVYVRVAPDGGAVLIDLGDDSWRAVRVTSEGWALIDRPHVRFRRPSGLRPLPTPERGGTIKELRRYVNVTDADFLLLVAWLTAASLPSGPYPILALSGEQGSAKSTLARSLRLLLDPHASPLRSEPKEPRDLMVSAVNAWVVAYDNLSSLPSWLSDALCRLATGGGFATRQLYSDSEEVFLDAQRPVVLTGIEDYVRRGDLADRCVFLHLPTIAETGRKTEDEFWSGFERDHARLFGAVLSAVAGGLRLLDSITLNRYPRMVDFGRWGEAVCRSLGCEPGSFLSAYDANRRGAVEAALEDSLVAAAVRVFLAERDAWEGTAAELLDELNRQHPEHAAIKDKDRWPRSPRGLSGHLRRLAPALRAVGLDVGFGRGHERGLWLSAVKRGEQRAHPTQRAQTPGKPPQPCAGRAPVAPASAPVAAVGAPIGKVDGPRPSHDPASYYAETCEGGACCDGRSPSLTGDGREVIEL